MSDNFDVIIIGAGHNGLTAAGYLVKGGLEICRDDQVNRIKRMEAT